VQTVVGAVIVDGGRVFAARRTEPDFLAGFWEFPGGKVEAGEDPRDALVREIQEELSATIQVREEIIDAESPWPVSADFCLRLFLASVVDGELVAGPDHDALQWVGSADLDSVDWLASDRLAMGAVRAALANDLSC
jgi:8-oxo-dGTP diphosphatase